MYLPNFRKTHFCVTHTMATHLEFKLNFDEKICYLLFSKANRHSSAFFMVEYKSMYNNACWFTKVKLSGAILILCQLFKLHVPPGIHLALILNFLILNKWDIIFFSKLIRIHDKYGFTNYTQTICKKKQNKFVRTIFLNVPPGIHLKNQHFSKIAAISQW